MWHISIPDRRTHPLFFRYPLYRNSERNRSIRTATQTTQRSLAIALRQTSPAHQAIAAAIRSPRTPRPSFCKHSCIKIFQRNKNIILCRSRAKNECRTPANAVNLQHFRKFSCNLQLCPRPAHIARFNERARAREPNQPNGFSTPPKSPTSFTDISPEEACSTLSTSAQPSKFCFWLNSALPEQLPLQPGAVLYWPRI